MTENWSTQTQADEGKKRLLIGILFFVIAGITGAGLVYMFKKERPQWMSLHNDELEPRGKVEDFELVDSSGKTFKPNQLSGKIWIANFIFTRCKLTCPVLTANMATLQKELPKNVILVSFSVDPEHDTPQVLEKFAKSFGAEPDRWIFLTGKKDVIYKLIRDVFKLHVMETPEDVTNPVSHTPHFVLIDQKGLIRNHYVGTNTADFSRIYQDVQKLNTKQ